METIKNYLESMFRSLPQTEQVLKAKQELFGMMEDKYTELINSGKSENEAIGTVISEFGNLDDLAEDLGISNENDAKKSFKETSRKVTKEEKDNFLGWRKKVALFRSLGIAFCILSVTSPIMFDSTSLSEIFGAVLLFISIAIGVVLIVYSGTNKDEWEFLKTTPCSLDDDTFNEVKKERKEYTKTQTMLNSIAIGCFILSPTPSILFDSFNSRFADNFGAALLFVFVAIGVFLCVYANIQANALNFLYGLNSYGVNSNPYFAADINKDSNKKEERESENKENSTNNANSDTQKKYYNPSSWETNDKELSVSRIKNPTVRKILSVYWYTVTCIYLIFSFVTFKWHVTWIIWPIAALIFTFIKTFSNKVDEE